MLRMEGRDDFASTPRQLLELEVQADHALQDPYELDLRGRLRPFGALILLAQTKETHSARLISANQL